MPLIWRGLGIAVPIVFFITGWIVSYWYDSGEAKLGNASYIGWTALFSGIVVLLLGLGLLGASGDSEDGAKKKHDFFYIPVFVWGLLLGALSLYLLVFKSDGETPDPVDNEQVVEGENPVAAPTTRKVHFYNPTADTLTYIVADEMGEGLISRKKVAPGSYLSLDLEKGTYLFSAFNQAKQTTLSLPAKEDAGDSTKYQRHEDEQGAFYQRILNPATKETDDYDEAWLVLDGKTSLALVNVTEVCDGTISADAIGDYDWTASVKERYPASDLVEPLFRMYMKDKNVRVIPPGGSMPAKANANEVWYLLVPVDAGADEAATLEAAVKAARG